MNTKIAKVRFRIRLLQLLFLAGVAIGLLTVAAGGTGIGLLLVALGAVGFFALLAIVGWFEAGEDSP